MREGMMLLWIYVFVFVFAMGALIRRALRMPEKDPHPCPAAKRLNRPMPQIRMFYRY